MIAAFCPSLRAARGLLALGLLGLALAQAVALAFPLLLRAAVDAINAGPTVGLAELGGLALALLLLQAVASALRTRSVMAAGAVIGQDLRQRLFSALLRAPEEGLHATPSGDRLARLGGDVDLVEEALSVELSWSLRHLCTAIGGVILLVGLSPTLAAIGLLALPPVALALRAHGQTLQRSGRDQRAAHGAVMTAAEELLNGILTLRRLGAEPWAEGRFAGALQELYTVGRQRAAAVGLWVGLLGLLRQAALAAVVLVGAQAVQAGSLSLGSLSAFLLIATTVTSALGELGGQGATLSRARAAAARLAETLQAGATQEAPAVPLPEGPLALSFQGVVAGWPGQERPVLSGLDLELPGGQSLGLVGASGAGKSTIVALLSGMLQAQGGRITLGGIDLRDLSRRSLRRAIAVVPQEVELFRGSLRENIGLASPDASLASICAAAEAAGVMRFAALLPDGLDAPVGPRGHQLSGGQRQRVAIARALLQDARVLVLDEATSALDQQSAEAIEAALEASRGERTVLLIGHRASAVAPAARLAVLDGGQIVEEGPTASLLTGASRARRLVA
jgi:ATP-binding cassette subfamily B protein